MGQKAILADLLELASGDDLGFEEKSGYVWVRTALMLASGKGDTEMVKMLLIAGADANQQDSVAGMTALMYAARGGHGATVQAHLVAGADVNLQNKDGWTALMWAAKNGHLEIVQILLESGADKYLQSKYEKKTAADYAKLERVRTLIHTHGRK